MKNLSSDHAAGNAAGADSFAQMRNSPQLLDDVYWDLQVANVLRKNLLIVGDERAVRGALEALWLDPDEPVLRWHPGQPLELPHGGGTGTLVLHDVRELSSVEQTRLLYWFEDSDARIRVVSTNPKPLWPRVISGAFSGTLYYRLNTVHVDMSGECGADSHSEKHASNGRRVGASRACEAWWESRSWKDNVSH